LWMQVLHLHPHCVLFIVRHLRQCTSSNTIWSEWIGGGGGRRSRSPKYICQIFFWTLNISETYSQARGSSESQLCRWWLEGSRWGRRSRLAYRWLKLK
jgi:hypothetical protein